MNKILLFALTLTIVSCASKPVLYPNSHLKTVGKEASKKDVDRCMDEASEYLKSSKGKQVAKGAGHGAILGSAVGAVSGLLTGNFTNSIGFGAAVGATAGGTGAALSPDQIKQRYTNRCLQEKGYEIIGWD